ncbi:ABC phosphonate transporter permease protein [Gottschalkia acidurici 9a]|uniref:ABC phosphonate transporter permease protein n=2 Tax=Clostridium acidurici TaxID=1556 RepID=K0AT99_GOTA9|nr:ABC phosphonate transporter permease protein [Gottschalkia acidurici 9a]
MVLISAFIWSLFSVSWGSDLIHSGGKNAIAQIIRSLFNPDLSEYVIKSALIAAWRTLVYAIAGMTLAIIIAFILGILASGVLSNNRVILYISKGIFRGILGLMRAIHELVWAWLFVAAIGLTPYAAIFAIAIPYGGILGRIFADILNDVPHEPIEALKSSGASRLQILFYTYLPIAKTDMISYTMYRFECAVRSSTIMSFVGLGGLGFQIQLALQDLNYSQAWTYMFFLLVLIVLIDFWSSLIRKDLVEGKSKLDFVKLSLILLSLLIAISWLYIYVVEKADFISLFSEKNAFYAKKFIKGMIGIGEESPAFLNMESWINIMKLTYETVQMSIMAIGFSTIGMILTVIPASRNVANGTLTLNKRWYSWIIFWICRFLYLFSRAVPELVWAMIIIFILKPGILPGAIALALHNFGILGKLCSEVVEDLDLRPIRNLSSSGAGTGQILVYSVIPTVMQKFLTFILYRWEVIIRTTIVVGFIGAGGLGMEFKLAMSYFKYSEITLILIFYMILVIFADLLSEGSRKLVE